MPYYFSRLMYSCVNSRQDVFADLRDAKGFLSKTKIGDALRYLGFNPLNKEVTFIGSKS